MLNQTHAYTQVHAYLHILNKCFQQNYTEQKQIHDKLKFYKIFHKIV